MNKETKMDMQRRAVNIAGGKYPGYVDWVIVSLIVFSALGLIFTAVMLSIALYWLAEDNPPAEIHRLQFTDDTITAGEDAYLEFVICRYTPAPVQVNRAWVGDIRYNVPTIYPEALDEGCTEGTVSVEVPDNLPPGDYRLDHEFIYFVNPLAKRSVHYDTNPVQVISPDES